MRQQNKPSSLHVDFLGLTVEISERVLRAWEEIPEKKRFRYLNQTYEAQKNARELERATNLRGRREQHDEQDEGPLFVCIPGESGEWKHHHSRGVIWSEWKYHSLGVLWSDEVKLIRAWRRGDALALRRMAESLLRGRAKPKRGEQIRDVLLKHWMTVASAGIPLEPNGICLIWFSAGAIEEVLRTAGLCDAGKTLKAFEVRIARLKLPKLPKAIVHLKHLQWCQDKRVVVM